MSPILSFVKSWLLLKYISVVSLPPNLMISEIIAMAEIPVYVVKGVWNLRTDQSQDPMYIIVFVHQHTYSNDLKLNTYTI